MEAEMAEGLGFQGLGFVGQALGLGFLDFEV